MESLNDPKIIGLAILFGSVPALLWLWFWLKEDKEKPEPKGLIFLSFILGMGATILVLPIEKFAKTITDNTTNLIIIISVIEEVMKLFAVSLLAFKSKYLDEPIDYPIYIITTALGFAALENALFLIEPIALKETTVGILTGNLRFLGATLLHTISSGMIGIMLGFAFHKKRIIRNMYLGLGIIFAVCLHSAFNFFILYNNGENIWKIFGALWLITIVFLFFIEILRRKRYQN